MTDADYPCTFCGTESDLERYSWVDQGRVLHACWPCIQSIAAMHPSTVRKEPEAE